ncbi:MAG: prepilin-type N-terminal cleavage/methylation domain-containing protein, partial [Campylobacterota bacterium]|nr:prepilin-type N-terminal cleavage/methylation domain-containing protein [Campylobacterota bacterium]
RRAFTMIELVFAIVIMGILGKFGVEFLARAYESYFNTTLHNRLQQQSEAAVTQLAARLQYRIKSSVEVNGSILRWVGYDIDGWRGSWDGTSMNVPNWSGFIDINQTANPATNFLHTPRSDTTLIDSTIAALSGGKSIADAAIIFTGASNPTSTIWGGTAVSDQSGELAHPITSSGTSGFQPLVDDFSGVDVYEFYKLAWTAYAIEHNRTGNNELELFYNFQPWKGDVYTDGDDSILMEDVNSFTYQTIGDVIKVQVCVNDDNIGGGFSVCKEKTIF